jgi:hypothetical protein
MHAQSRAIVVRHDKSYMNAYILTYTLTFHGNGNSF